MSELVERQAVMESLKKEYNRKHTAGGGLKLAWIEKAVNEVPEKKGHWTEVNDPNESPYFRRRWYCSSCGDWQTYGDTPYCPSCGARMEVDR